ncbi:MAG TPA: hypothetical protein VII91_08890 [Bauldia sp.]
MTTKILSALAALAIAGGMVAAAPAAQAAGVGIYVNPGIAPPGPSNCWHWSHHQRRWVWACSSPEYYPYYNSPGPILGFSFGSGPNYGPDHHRRRMR